MQVVLYSRDGSDTIEDVSSRITGLRFSTKLHGGFAACSFSFKKDMRKAYVWYRDYLGYVVRVYSSRGELAWEGRVEDVELPSMKISCYGFYNYIGDKYYDDGSLETTAYELYASTNQDSGYTLDNGRKGAQSFYFDDDRPIDAVSFYVKNTNAEGDLSVSIYADSSGPTGSALVSSSNYEMSNIGSSMAYFTFALPASYLFTTGTTYWVSLEASSLDTEQGTLAYLTTPARFQDDGQDFSDWETTSGNAVYKITIINSDSTITWGFMGADSTTTNTNDTIAVYTDQGLTSAGWNGTSPSGKTPSTYVVQAYGAITMGLDSSTPSYSKGSFASWNGVSWTVDTGKDAIFQIYVRGKWDYTTSTATVKDIITDVLGNISYLSTDLTRLSNNGAIIGAIKFSNNEKSHQVIERVCKYGASSGTEPIYFAIWENEIAYLFPKSSYGHFWNVRLRDLSGAQGYSLVRSLAKMYNRVAAIFSDESGQQDVTAWSGDTDSQTDFGMTREIRLQSGNVTETVAIILRDLVLEDRKDAHQASNLTLQNVLSENNRREELWKVRAGDMIRLVDVDPDSAISNTSVFDDTRRMFVMETQYDADRHTLRVTPDIEKRELDVIATQLGVAGVGGF